jgi:hypothetical protein
MTVYVWAPLSPAGARELFAAFERPWWVAGGWALDMHLGRETRAHADIDLAIARGDEVALPVLLPEWEICIAHEGGLTPWTGDAPLSMPYHQFWVRRAGAEAWSFEVLLEDHDGPAWQYRRDHRVTIPLDRMGRVSPDGIPYVAPEIALLYKAKGIENDGAGVDAAAPRWRAKNAADFDAALPALEPAARAWLREALTIAHPDHPWLARL